MRISDWSSDVCSSDLPAIFIDGFIIFPDGRGKAVMNFQVDRKFCHFAVNSAAQSARPGIPIAIEIAFTHIKKMVVIHRPCEDCPACRAKRSGQQVDRSIFVRDRAEGNMRSSSTQPACYCPQTRQRSEEHTSELQSLMRTSYA